MLDCVFFKECIFCMLAAFMSKITRSQEPSPISSLFLYMALFKIAIYIHYKMRFREIAFWGEHFLLFIYLCKPGILRKKYIFTVIVPSTVTVQV